MIRDLFISDWVGNIGWSWRRLGQPANGTVAPLPVVKIIQPEADIDQIRRAKEPK